MTVVLKSSVGKSKGIYSEWFKWILSAHETLVAWIINYTLMASQLLTVHVQYLCVMVDFDPLVTIDDVKLSGGHLKIKGMTYSKGVSVVVHFRDEIQLQIKKRENSWHLVCSIAAVDIKLDLVLDWIKKSNELKTPIALPFNVEFEVPKIELTISNFHESLDHSIDQLITVAYGNEELISLLQSLKLVLSKISVMKPAVFTVNDLVLSAVKSPKRYLDYGINFGLEKLLCKFGEEKLDSSLEIIELKSSFELALQKEIGLSKCKLSCARVLCFLNSFKDHFKWFGIFRLLRSFVAHVTSESKGDEEDKSVVPSFFSYFPSLKIKDKLVDSCVDLVLIRFANETDDPNVLQVLSLNFSKIITTLEGDSTSEQTHFVTHTGIENVQAFFFTFNLLFQCLNLSINFTDSEKYIPIKEDILFIVEPTTKPIKIISTDSVAFTEQTRCFNKTSRKRSAFGKIKRARRRWAPEWMSDSRIGIGKLINTSNNNTNVLNSKTVHVSMKLGQVQVILNSSFLEFAFKLTDSMKLTAITIPKKEAGESSLFYNLTIETFKVHLIKEIELIISVSSFHVWNTLSLYPNVSFELIQGHWNEKAFICIEECSSNCEKESGCSTVKLNVKNAVICWDLGILIDLMSWQTLARRNQQEESTKESAFQMICFCETFSLEFCFPVIKDSAFPYTSMSVICANLEVTKNYQSKKFVFMSNSIKLFPFQNSETENLHIVSMENALLTNLVPSVWQNDKTPLLHSYDGLTKGEPSWNTSYNGELFQYVRDLQSWIVQPNDFSILFSKLQFNLPHREPLGYFFDHLNVTRRIILDHISLRSSPEVFEWVLHLNVNSVEMEVQDDPFEYKLNSIFQKLKKFSSIYWETERAFWNNAKKYLKVSSGKMADIDFEYFFKFPLAFTTSNGKELIESKKLYETFFALKEMNSNTWISYFKIAEEPVIPLCSLMLRNVYSRITVHPLLMRPETLFPIFRGFEPESDVTLEVFREFQMSRAFFFTFQNDTFLLRLRNFPNSLIDNGKCSSSGFLMLTTDPSTKLAEYRNSVLLDEKKKIDLVRSCLPVKLYYSFNLRCVDSVTINWGVPMDSVVTKYIKALSLLTKQSVDCSPRLPSWDRARLFIHPMKPSMTMVKGVHFQMIASTDPYNVKEKLCFVAPAQFLISFDKSILCFQGDLSCFIQTSSVPGFASALKQEGFPFLVADHKTFQSKFEIPSDYIMVAYYPNLEFNLHISWKCGALHHTKIQPCSTEYQSFNENMQNYDAYADFKSKSFSIIMYFRHKNHSHTQQSMICIYPQMTDWFKRFRALQLNYRNIVFNGDLFFDQDIAVLQLPLNRERFKMFQYLSDIIIHLDYDNIQIRHLRFDWNFRDFVGLLHLSTKSRYVFHINHRIVVGKIQSKTCWYLQYVEIDILDLTSAVLLSPCELAEQDMDESVELGIPGVYVVKFFWAPQLLYFKIDELNDVISEEISNEDIDDSTLRFFLENAKMVDSKLTERLAALNTLDPDVEFELFQQAKRNVSILVEDKENLTKYVGFLRSLAKEVRQVPLRTVTENNNLAINRITLFHPSMWWKNSIRDIIFRFYYVGNQNDIFKFYLTSGAVKHMNEIVKDIEQPATIGATPVVSPLPLDPNANPMLNMLDSDKERFATDSDKERSFSFDFNNKVNSDVPGGYISSKFKFQIIHPQVNMHTPEDADLLIGGSILVTAEKSTIEINKFSDCDKNLDLKTKTVVKIDGMRLFVCNVKNMTKNSPQFMPNAYLADYSGDTGIYSRVTEKVNCNVLMEMFNPTFVNVRQSQSGREIFEENETDSTTIYFPSIQIKCTSEQYSIIYDILSRVLIYREPSKKIHLDGVKTFLLAMDSCEVGEVTSLFFNLQERIKSLNLLMKDLCPIKDEAAQSLWERGQVQLREAQLDLSMMMEAFKKDLVIRKTKQKNPGVEMTTCVQIGQLTWDMMLEPSSYLCRWQMDKSSFSFINDEDDSTRNELVVHSLTLINKLPFPIYVQILTPFSEKGASETDHQDLLVFRWKDLAPVGGISVSEYVEATLAPLSIQISHDFASKLVSFVYPEKMKQKKAFLVQQTTTRPRSFSDTDVHSSYSLIMEPDIEKMKSRAESNRLFSYIRLEAGSHRVSYKARLPLLQCNYQGRKEKNIEDIENFLLKLPTLEYRNKTCGYYDVLTFIRRDVFITMLSHTGSLVKEKFRRLRKLKSNLDSNESGNQEQNNRASSSPERPLSIGSQSALTAEKKGFLATFRQSFKKKETETEDSSSLSNDEQKAMMLLGKPNK